MFPILMAAPHDHAGPFCVFNHTSGKAVRRALLGHMLGKPYTNLQALAATEVATGGGDPISAKVFVRNGNIEGGYVRDGNIPYLLSGSEEALPHVLTDLANPQTSLLSGRFVLLEKAQSASVFTHSSMTSSVVEAWKKADGGDAVVRPASKSYLYSDVLQPPALPEDNGQFALKRYDPKTGSLGDLADILGVPLNELQKLQRNSPSQIMQGLKLTDLYIAQPTANIRQARYNVVPISQSGASLQRCSITPQPGSAVAGLVERYKNGDNQEECSRQITALLMPEVTGHIACLARTMQKEGRWLMAWFEVGPPGTYPLLAFEDVVTQLGFVSAGGQDLVTLQKKSAAPQP